jgi:hypothetical protein
MGEPSDPAFSRSFVLLERLKKKREEFVVQKNKNSPIKCKKKTTSPLSPAEWPRADDNCALADEVYQLKSALWRKEQECKELRATSVDEREKTVALIEETMQKAESYAAKNKELEKKLAEQIASRALEVNRQCDAEELEAAQAMVDSAITVSSLLKRKVVELAIKANVLNSSKIEAEKRASEAESVADMLMQELSLLGETEAEQNGGEDNEQNEMGEDDEQHEMGEDDEQHVSEQVPSDEEETY